MKYRTGFVSNSSSSSYTCVVCGREESGMDLDLSECDMVGSDYGVYCEEHLNEFLKKRGLKKEFDELTEDDDDLGWGCMETWGDDKGKYNKYCPLFNLYYVADQTLLNYALHKLGATKGDVVAEIQNQFGNLNEVTALFPEKEDK
jgi:hypothetical protein